MALQQLNIATAIVTVAFTVAIAAMALASAVAFGLGNRELAGRITREWYEHRGSARHYDASSARPPGSLDEHLHAQRDLGSEEKGAEYPHH
jgi:hypothetical protein